MGALDTAVRSGKARYAGISSYGPQRTAEAAQIMRDLGTPLLIHQPSYSMLNRWMPSSLWRPVHPLAPSLPRPSVETLPSLGVVLLSLGVLLEDFAVVVAALIVGVAGVMLEVVLGKAAINGLGKLV